MLPDGYIPIATAGELKQIEDNSTNTFGAGTEYEDEYEGGYDKQYILLQDINLAGANFEPIGFAGGYGYTAFTGVFDGNRKVIKNGTINYPGDHWIGLFAFNLGIIRNVGIENVNVTGNDMVGGLVGMSLGHVIKSYGTGDVRGSSGGVGGLVGANGNVWNTGSGIVESYATGEVIGNGWLSSAGGLAGLNRGNITNSYATGKVDGFDISGGLIGRNYGSITNSYAIGLVGGGLEGDGANHGPAAGGLIGKHETGGLYTSSFWNTQTSNQATSAGGEGRTTAQMQNATASATYDGHRYTGWSNSIWIFTPSNQYPRLRWQ